MDNFYQSLSSLFTNHFEVHSRRCMFLQKKRFCEYLLARIAIALNCPAQCLDKSSIKTSKAFPPAKQAITVGSSSRFILKLLPEWSNFDLPKLVSAEHISLMPASCLSLSNTCQDKRQQVTYYGSANQEFVDPSIPQSEMNKMGLL